MADQCYVKVYDEVGSGRSPTTTPRARRVDRCYRIFPMVFDPNFHELEYFVPLERGPAGVAGDARAHAARACPASVYPLEVRTVGADEAFLSPQYRTATTVISVSGTPGTDYWGYLRSVDRAARRVRRAGPLGQAALPHARAAARAVPPRRTTSSRSAASSTRRASSSTTTCARCSPSRRYDARARPAGRPRTMPPRRAGEWDVSRL